MRSSGSLRLVNPKSGTCQSVVVAYFVVPVPHAGERAGFTGNRNVDALYANRASRNASRLDSASLREVKGGYSAKEDEARGQQGIGECERLLALLVWLATAPAERLVRNQRGPPVMN